MPAVSGKQYRLMQAAAHGVLRKKDGPSPAVAREFIAVTPPAKRRAFSVPHLIGKPKRKA